MNTRDFEELISISEDGFKIEELEPLEEAVINLSPTGKEIKSKIKNVIDKHDEDGIVDGAKKLVKTKGYDRRMSDRITSGVKSLFTTSFHTDIIKRPLSVPIAGTNINKALYTQHWVALQHGHLYTFAISYNANGAILVGPREQSAAFFLYPIDIIEKAIQWCDEGSELSFSKNRISSKGLDGAEIINNTLYDKLERYIQDKYPKMKYKRSNFGIIFKQK